MKAVFCIKPGAPKEYFITSSWGNDIEHLGHGWVWEDEIPEGYVEVPRNKYIKPLGTFIKG